MLPDQPISPSAQIFSPKKVEFRRPSETRPVPRDNTFAVQKREEKARHERHRRDGNFWYNQKQTMAGNPVFEKDGTGPQIKDGRSEPEISPAMTTISSLIAASASHETSQPVSPMEDLELIPKNKEHVQPTARESLEHKTEKRLQKMMGQAPSTPSPTEAETFSANARSTPNKPHIKTIQHDRPKSPTKRFFDKLGIPLPNFSKPHFEEPKLKTMSDNVPPKAAQFFGTLSSEPTRIQTQTTPKKNKKAAKPSASVPARFSDRARRDANAIPLDPADIASHIPNKVSIKHDGSVSTYPPASSVLAHSRSLKYLEEQDGESLKTGPPTPPSKDTPPKLKVHIPSRPKRLPEFLGTFELPVDPTTQSKTEVLVDPGNRSPTRGGGFATKEHVTTIEKVPSTYSMRAALDIVGDDDGKSSLGGQSFRRRSGRWSDGEQEHAWATQGLLPGGRLPPTVYSTDIYSPSIYSVQNTSRQDLRTAPRTYAYERRIPPCILPPAPHTRNFSISQKTTSQKPSQATLPVVFRGEPSEVTSGVGSLTFEPPATSVSRARPPVTDTGESPSATFNEQSDMVRARSQSGPSKSFCENDCAESNTGSGHDDSVSNMRTGIEQLGIRSIKTPTKPFQDLPSVPSTIQADQVPHAGQPAESFPGLHFAQLGNPTNFFLDSQSPGHFGLPQFPSAIPTPLYGRGHDSNNMGDQSHGSLPPVPLSATLPDGSHILTHFDVVHHHLEQVATRLTSVTSTRDSQFSSLMRKLDENSKESETHYGDLREHLQGVEHHIGRMSSEMETTIKSIAELSNAVKGTMASNVADLAKTNQSLAKAVHSLEKRLGETTNKLDTLQQQVSTVNSASAMSPSSANSTALTTSQASAGAMG
ncbi:MAG: hypothetical protein Q9157_004991, partial [Trypethelium eluteriae]